MIKNIQALRFLAAMAVVIFHASLFYRAYEGTTLKPFIDIMTPWGKLGVDLFFVISGFVIWASTEARHNSKDVAPFMFRRLARVYTSYWPALIIAAMIGWSKFVDISLSGSLSAITLAPSEMVPSGEVILPVRWTLTYEVIFYFAFALCMILPRIWQLTVIISWGIFSIVLNSTATSLSPFIAEFSMGCGLAYLASRFDLSRAPLLPVVLISILLFAGGVPHLEDPVWRVAWFGSWAAFVVVFAISAEKKGLIASKFFTEMGSASYALYLLHFPILQLFAKFWPTMKAHPDTMIASAIVVSLLASWLWWRYFEKPMIKRISNFSKLKLQRNIPVSDAG